MKKAAGFTLIELVIVIVILGILGAVAAPRFLNLQGDAYAANVNALKGSIQSAMTLGNAKAILAGQDNSTIDNTDPGNPVVQQQQIEIDGISSDVSFQYGFPSLGTAPDYDNGILLMLQDLDFAVVANAANLDTDATYNVLVSGNTMRIAPSARGFGSDDDTKCEALYTQAVASTPASVVAFTGGC